MIVAFEGLWGYSERSPGKLGTLLKKVGLFDHTMYLPWDAWKTAPDADTVIGYSFGGYSAMLYSANRKVKRIVTIDPRAHLFWPKSMFTILDVKWDNFYQDKSCFLPGLPVAGAENTKLLDRTHFNICDHHMVRNALLEIKTEKNIPTV